MLSVLLRVAPKIGPFKGLAFKNPTPQTEDLYIKSINVTVDQYHADLKNAGTNTLRLANYDLDSGNPTRAGEYSLADETYARLLSQLAAGNFEQTSTELRDNILQFYSDPSAAIATKADASRWQGVMASLDRVKSEVPVRSVATKPMP